MRCPGITSCNNHKACQSSWENIKKLIRIRKHSCPSTAHVVPLHAHPKPLWTQHCKAGGINCPMQEETAKISRSLAPNHYDGARERLGGKDSYQEKVAEVGKSI